jgi:hypothetical protein
MSKDLLFYSNYCDFCKEVINVLIKKNVRTKFLLVCVDTRKFDIPSFIDRVPSILNCKNGEVYMDNDVYKYIDNIYLSTIQQQDISPLFSMYGNSMYSSSFSSLNEEDERESKNYVWLGDDSPINPQVEETKSKSDKLDSSCFERYLETRKNDDTYMKRILDANNTGERMMASLN